MLMRMKKGVSITHHRWVLLIKRMYVYIKCTDVTVLTQIQVKEDRLKSALRSSASNLNSIWPHPIIEVAIIIGHYTMTIGLAEIIRFAAIDPHLLSVGIHKGHILNLMCPTPSYFVLGRVWLILCWHLTQHVIRRWWRGSTTRWWSGHRSSRWHWILRWSVVIRRKRLLWLLQHLNLCLPQLL